MSFRASGKRRDGTAEPPGAGDDGVAGRARAAFEALADGIIIVSREHRVEFINRAAASMNDVNQDEITGATLGDLAESSAIEWSEISDAIESNKRAEIISHNVRGRPFLTCLRFLRGSDGRSEGVLISQCDLEVFDHDRRRASFGQAENTFRFLNERALRPDFARQRSQSEALDHILAQGERAMTQGARVLLLGESGVGKTEIARHLNEFLNEKTAPFVHVNCGAIPESLFESEMFGYERGAFTGALQSGKRGLIEDADGGTLFLDEIGEIPLTVQAKLLKFLEDGVVQRIGSGKSKVVRVRVISATNRDLVEMIEEGTFRKDLYYRIAVISLLVKPLREMPELIDHMIDRFVTLINQRRSTSLEMSPDCLEKLRAYSYPGNIRELHNLIQLLAVTCERRAESRDLPEQVLLGRHQAAGPDMEPALDEAEYDLKNRVRAYEKKLIDQAVALHGSKRKAAQALGVDIGTIVRKTQIKH